MERKKIRYNFAPFLIAKYCFIILKIYTTMKKIALSLAVLFSVALVSCGNKNAEATDSDSMVEETIVEAAVEETVDTATNDTTVQVEAVEATAEVPAETPAK